MIPIEDLPDVTLAIEDTDEYDEGDEDDEEDSTDVTLVSDDTYWRLDWCYTSNRGYQWGWWRRWRWWKRLDWCDPGEWWYLLKTWLMLL